MIVYLARVIPAFVMYCVNGASHSSLLIESTDSTIYNFWSGLVVQSCMISLVQRSCWGHVESNLLYGTHVYHLSSFFFSFSMEKEMFRLVLLPCFDLRT